MAEIVIKRTNATREDLAWAAGLFEGEGCFSKTKTAPSAVIGSTDLDVLLRFHKLIGVGRVGTRKPKPPFKVMHYWATAGYPSFQYVVGVLWEWLHARRRERAEEILKLFRDHYPAKKLKTCKRGHELTDPMDGNKRFCRTCRKMHFKRWYANGGKAVRKKYDHDYHLAHPDRKKREAGFEPLFGGWIDVEGI